MPINYQAPSPPSAYLHAASNFNPGAAAALIGREEELGVQQGLERERMLYQGSQQAEIESARLQAAAAAQERHAQLQVWVNGQEMTQAEQMQLRQDQNAIAWINGQRGKSLTNQEADDAIAQRMARVNLGQQRLQAQDLKLKQQQTEHVKAQTDIQNAIYHSYTQAADDKIATVIKPEFKAAARQAAIDANLDPDSDAGKQESQAWAAMNGGVIAGTVQKDGTIKPITEGRAASAAGESKGQNPTAQQHEARFASELKGVIALSKEKNDDGTPKHPELQTPEAQYAAAEQRATAAHAYGQKMTAGSKGEAEARHKEQLDSVPVSRENIMKRTDLPPMLKQAQIDKLNEIEGLLKRYPPSAHPTERIRARIAELQRQFDNLASINPAVRDVPPTKITPEMIQTTGGGYELSPLLKGALQRIGETPAGGM